jgi:cytochrome b561
LFYVVNTGFLENPKPHQTPLDSAKPALLWIQAIIALVAGLFLIFVAVRQSKSQEKLILTAENEPQRYGRVSRLLHWTTAGLFLTLIPMGIFTSIIPEQTEYRNAYYVVHKTLGVTALLLLVIRLLWNRISQRPALDSTLTSGERQLARVAHFTLYMMMLALPVTGFMMTSLHGYPTYFFAWELAPLWPQSDAYILWGAMHKYLLPYLLYIVLGAHILGAMKHHYVDKKANAFKRMGG